MKVRLEQLATLQENEARQKAKGPAEGFESLLQGELGREQAPGVTPALDTRSAMLQGLNASELLQGVQGLEAEQLVSPALVENASSQMESIFSSFERYASELGKNQKADLRSAYGLLENMNTEIASFKAAFPDLEKQAPELAAMATELDVLARVETLKFNRGDFL